MNYVIPLVLIGVTFASSVIDQQITRLTETGARNRTGAWAPDGNRIAFGSNRTGRWQLWLMDADGGNPVQLTYQSEPVGGPSWTPDATTIWFESGFRLFQLRVDGRQPTPFEVPHESSFRPVPSPDGKRLLFDVSQEANHDIWVLGLADPPAEPKQLTSDPAYDSDARWSPDGSAIVFHSDRGAERFHTQVFTMSPDGKNIKRLTTGPGINGYPAWSPNGRCIVYTFESDGNRDLWLMDQSGGNKHRLTHYDGFDGDPSWSPNGGAILFSTARWGGEELALVRISPTDAQRCEA